MSNNKIITASAGTGKTYRLSLEYIRILMDVSRQLSPQQADYRHLLEQVLVITFTRKATAEIRARIFEHLSVLCYGEDRQQAEELKKQIANLSHSEYGQKEWEKLIHIYEWMLQHKDQVQVSTIDSFINTIFKSIIAPYLGIQDYKVENKANIDLEEQLYGEILGEGTFEAFEPLFKRVLGKTIEGYKHIIHMLLDQRWVYHFIQESKQEAVSNNSILQGFRQHSAEALERVISDKYESFVELYGGVVRDIDKLLVSLSDKPLSKIISASFVKLWELGEEKSGFVETVLRKLKDRELCAKSYDVYLSRTEFWNKSGMSKDVKALLEQKIATLQEALESLSLALLLEHGLKEDTEILAGWGKLLDMYDRIKLRQPVFTYQDITYYTFKHLYDPALSLIDSSNGSVANVFYEFLTGRIRFMLIDEFQDTSVTQFAILMPIIAELTSGEGSKEYGGVIVVGDEKQSIYGWRGGERELLSQLPNIIHGADKDILDKNYRSVSTLLEFVNAVFSDTTMHDKIKSNGMEWEYNEVQAYRKEEGYIGACFRNYSSSGKAINSAKDKDKTYREFVEKIVIPATKKEGFVASETAIMARENKELDAIASILKEYNIAFIQESSRTLLTHPVVKPFVWLLRFLHTHDWHYIIRFLRSDLVFISMQEFDDFLRCWKQIAGLEEKQEIWQRMQTPAFIKLYELLSSYQNGHYRAFCEKIIAAYPIKEVYNTEHDMKNLQLFLDIITQFETCNTDNMPTLSNLIAYIEETEEKQNVTQASMQFRDAITLITIHKSKGLEYGNIFYYHDLSAVNYSGAASLQYYLRFKKPRLYPVEDYIVTIQYDKMYETALKGYLINETRSKAALDELNNLYVALTRARNNLFIYAVYRQDEGLQKLFDEKLDKEKTDYRILLFKAIYEWFATNSSWISNEIGDMSEIGVWKSSPLKQKLVETQGEALPSLSPWFDKKDWELIPKEEDDSNHLHAVLKTLYLDDRMQLIGNAAHTWLSWIKYATEAEQKLATAKLVQQYGNLLTTSEISKIVQKLSQFVNENDELFSKKWNRVFTEYSVFALSGKEYRIDRLLINEESKIVNIVDYKTGIHYEEKQLAQYEMLLKGFPWAENYEFQRRYVEIKINI